ncbi:transcriptional repressor NrdR [Patescibacteria group bacterium]|nr:transcriptional repressor NrdR [Patescibacteria group bacterium]
MRCPFCAKVNTQVLESRAVEEGAAIRRRRECGKCHKRFTTYEKVKGAALWVIKKDLRREPFDREKIRRGILRAIEKRTVTLDLVDEVVDVVEREMLRKESEEIPSKIIGSAVLKRLKKIDKVAWMRFASVYLEFEDLKDFEKAIDKR